MEIQELRTDIDKISQAGILRDIILGYYLDKLRFQRQEAGSKRRAMFKLWYFHGN